MKLQLQMSECYTVADLALEKPAPTASAFTHVSTQKVEVDGECPKTELPKGQRQQSHHPFGK